MSNLNDGLPVDGPMHPELRAMVGEIQIADAHMWWSFEKKFFRIEEFGSPLDRMVLRSRMEGLCDMGACDVDWESRPDDERVQWIVALAVECMVGGMDPRMIIGQCAKVRQFLALGKTDTFWCRTLTDVILGKPFHGPDEFYAKIGKF